eukprot:6791014-Prymnesium_polylepis.1
MAGERPSDFMAYSLAATLRFLTPMGEQPRLGEHPPVRRPSNPISQLHQPLSQPKSQSHKPNPHRNSAN